MVEEVTGNVIGGNLTTVGLVNATGNVTGGNLTSAGVVEVTGNVIGGNLNDSRSRTPQLVTYLVVT